MNEKDIEQGMAALSATDKDIARAYEIIGPPAPRLRSNSFESLLSIIVSQQISTEAARAIMLRVSSLLPTITGESLLAIDAQALRDAGLSWRKVEYAKSLANAVTSGKLNIESLSQCSDQEVIEQITNLKGFGPWSAEIYLMFSLNRADIFPTDDLALLIALGRLKRLDEKPSPSQARSLVEHWSPYRSIGALFLWHYYRGAPV